MEGMLKYNYAEPDATSTAHANIDEILAGNKAKHQQAQYDLHGTIGPTPHWETEEGQQEMYDIAEGFAFPGSALGRVAKGAITGGHLSRAGKPGKDFYHRLLKDMSPKEFVQRADWDEQLNNARKLMEKAFKKWGGIKHNQTVNDPVTEILRASKYRKN